MRLPALVLTAGRGTRLDPLTRIVAKAAVPLGDRTLIEHVLAWVRAQGVRDVVLNLHHLPATITSIVGHGAHLGLSVRYSWEQPLLGSAGGPRRALPLLDAEAFLIVNGDTLCDFDVAPMVAAHERTGAAVTMAVVPNADPAHYNGVVVDEHGIVTGFAPRGRADGTFHFIGVQVAEARLFRSLADGVPAETVAGLYRDLVVSQPGQVRAWQPTTSFLDVGTPRDYLNACRAAEPAAGATRSVVWPGATVDGADIEDCIVIGDVRLPAGFQARSSVLAPAAVVRDGDRVTVREGVAIFPIA
jgi:mannose-1-phosphate guanylyltransferase